MLRGIESQVRQVESGGLSVVLSRIPGVTKRRLLREPLYFQVAPVDQFGWETTYNWTDYDTISAGQFTTDGGTRLRSLSINSMVMSYNTPWASYSDSNGDAWAGESPDPRTVVIGLDNLASAGTPIMLTVTGPVSYEPELEMPTTLRRISFEERAGEPDTRYFSMDFVEYRTPVVKRKGYGDKHDLPATVKINSEGVAFEFRRDGKKLKEKQIHKIGSPSQPATLRKLSKHFYGTTKLWKRIAAKNNLKIKNWGPDESLEKLYDKRKRKNDAVTLVIPERPKKGSGSGGVSINA
jgi:hypothetical protein